MSSLTAYNSGRLQAGHPPGVQQERDDHPDQQELGAVLQSKPCGPPLETRKRIGDHDHGEAPCSAGEIRMIYPLRRVSPFSPIPISGKSPNSATSKRVSEGRRKSFARLRGVKGFAGSEVIKTSRVFVVRGCAGSCRCPLSVHSTWPRHDRRDEPDG